MDKRNRNNRQWFVNSHGFKKPPSFSLPKARRDSLIKPRSPGPAAYIIEPPFEFKRSSSKQSGRTISPKSSLSGATLVAAKRKEYNLSKVGPGCYNPQDSSQKLLPSFNKSYRSYFVNNHTEVADAFRVSLGNIGKPIKEKSKPVPASPVSHSNQKHASSQAVFRLTRESTPSPGDYQNQTDFGCTNLLVNNSIFQNEPLIQTPLKQPP